MSQLNFDEGFQNAGMSRDEIAFAQGVMRDEHLRSAVQKAAAERPDQQISVLQWIIDLLRALHAFLFGRKEDPSLNSSARVAASEFAANNPKIFSKMPIPPANPEAPVNIPPSRPGDADFMPGKSVKKLYGELIRHGKAHFEFNKENPMNYFVVLRDKNGAEVIQWGKELEAAMREAGPQAGQFITLVDLGKKPVTVNVAEKKDGKVTWVPKDVIRGSWRVDIGKPDAKSANDIEAEGGDAPAPR